MVPEFSVFDVNLPWQEVSPAEEANTALQPFESLKSKDADNGGIFRTHFFHKQREISVRGIRFGAFKRSQAKKQRPRPDTV